MATYTVNITGSLYSSYAYATLNGTKTTTTGTNTYTSKPTIAVYVSSPYSSVRTMCKVTLNGTTVKSGYGSYTVDIGDADAVNIQFNIVDPNGNRYYTCDITTETSTPPDPMAPHDGHNTNIGQVARQIEGGTVLIGGVLREIESGMTRVNSVAREFEFGSKKCTITISGKGDSTYGYLMINGTKYIGAATLEVEAGTIVSACVYYNLQIDVGYVYVNGTQVYTFNDYPSGSGDVGYQYTVNGDVKIELDKNKIYFTEQ